MFGLSRMTCITILPLSIKSNNRIHTTRSMVYTVGSIVHDQRVCEKQKSLPTKNIIGPCSYGHNDANF